MKDTEGRVQKEEGAVAWRRSPLLLAVLDCHGRPSGSLAMTSKARSEQVRSRQANPPVIASPAVGEGAAISTVYRCVGGEGSGFADRNRNVTPLIHRDSRSGWHQGCRIVVLDDDGSHFFAPCQLTSSHHSRIQPPDVLPEVSTPGFLQSSFRDRRCR